VGTLRDRRANSSEERYSLTDYVQWLSTTGARFPSVVRGAESNVAALPASDFDGLAAVYRSNGVVAACMNARLRVFSEVVFRFASVRDGKVQGLFGTPALRLLEKPWPNGTTGELAARMIQDADLDGQFYACEYGGRIYRREPSKVAIVLTGDPAQDEFVDVAGYVYRPGGSTGPVYTYTPSEMMHWSPLPDPLHPYRGMSWITPVLREIRADNAATDHKAGFFANGATPSMVVKFPPDIMTEEQFERFKGKMRAELEGAGKSYKTLYLAPGTDVDVVGKDFQQLDFNATQGRDETRIASAAGVPAVLIGLKESLQGSSLNQGNFASARRAFADMTMRPLYRSAAAALETLVPAPQDKGASKLWYDDSQISFFREDVADAANIQQTKALTIRQLVDAGYTPESAVAAIEAEDITLLQHSGLYSVQLQAPGEQQAKPPARSVEQLEATRSVDTEGNVTFNVTVPVHLPERAEQPAPVVNVAPPAVHMAAPVVNVSVPEQPAPVVNVTVEPTPVTVENRTEVKPADVMLLPSEPKTRRVVRNSKGEIVQVVEE
jgi:phage portal protein BeeE